MSDLLLYAVRNFKKSYANIYFVSEPENYGNSEKTL